MLNYYKHTLAQHLPSEKYPHNAFLRRAVQAIMKSKSNNERWDFVAHTARELAAIDDKLFKAKKQKFLDEQVQMTRLLQALSKTSLSKFPFRVRHEGENFVPDFQLESGGLRIGVELSKVAEQAIEHARHLQGEVKETLTIGSWYLRKPRRRSDVDRAAFLIPPKVYGISEIEYRKIWLNKVAAELDDKTRVLQAKRFRHGDEDWLVLWDYIGLAGYAFEQRIECLQRVLVSRWGHDWYSRVFLQDIYFRWMVAFAPTEIPVIIRSNFQT